MSDLHIQVLDNQLHFVCNNELILNRLSNTQKETAITHANEKLEKDLEFYVNKIAHLKNGHFAWIITYEPLRLDDLQGVISWYYILEILPIIYTQNEISRVILGEGFPYYFLHEIQKLNSSIPVIYKAKSYTLRKKLHKVIAPLKTFYHALKTSRSEKLAKDAIWISTSADFKRNRYKSLLNHFQNTPLLAYHAQHVTSIYNLPSDISNLNFAQFSKTQDIISSFSTAIALKRKLKTPESTLVGAFIKNQSTTQIASMVLREKMVSRAMDILKPKALFFTTANTYPPARLMTRLAYMKNIPSVIVACRPMLSNLRPEERACKVDLLPNHNALIGNYFIVWDTFSKNTLISQKIDPKKIYIYKNQPSSIKASIIIENALFILFTHEYEMNEGIITVLKQIGDKNLPRLVVRTHPLCELTNSQKETLATIDPTYQDISKKSMGDFQWINTFALTINSTAAVEASSLGCGILWLPFLNERSVLFYPVMKILGKPFSNIDELATFFEEDYKNEKTQKQLIEDCIKSYQKNFEGQDQINSLFEQINIKPISN